MQSGSPKHEIEVKLRISGAADARQRLEAAGFALTRERLFESNIIYDRPGRDLRRAGELLRLRTCGGNAILTFKGPSIDARHKTREEIETAVSDAAAFVGILERLGFEPSFRYEKYRTEFARPGETGHAVLDETPIGGFLELEGPPEWIDAAARALGFTERDYITATYADLYFEYCRRETAAPPDMVFSP